MTYGCKAIVDFINCDYELFDGKGNGGVITERFNELTAQGKTDGFYPLIIIPSDTLAEIIEFFIEDSSTENTPENIVEYRRKIIEEANKINAAKLLSMRFNENSKYHSEERLLGQFISSQSMDEISLHMLEYGDCEEVIIAKIPAENPWELAAWLPMGGFNECPMPKEQTAIFKYWYEKYGAVPAVVSSDIWEMTITKPVLTNEEAEVLAKEHYAFCNDTVDQGAETIRALASTLKNSSVWFFWWD